MKKNQQHLFSYYLYALLTATDGDQKHLFKFVVENDKNERTWQHCTSSNNENMSQE